MTTGELVFLSLYFAVLTVLAIYGSHRYRMTYLYYRFKYKFPTPAGTLPALPRVTVQLPLFNEVNVAERLIDTVCRIRYPLTHLEVQVLDDSTDETVEVARAAVARWRAQGLDIRHIHRTDRTGYKAGALENGLAQATGEYVAVFDADFLPPEDFLEKTIPYFADAKVGMVQVRWGHINKEHSLLTKAQSILLDGHFVIEHTARSRSGCFFNFNGTAGVWRRATITDAGGWHHDTLTEDLDLSYRAQLKGWRFVFLPHVVSPAEVPADINAFKSQQHRWAKGSIQTAKKLLPVILRSRLPAAVKVEAFFHLTNNISYLLMVVLALMMPISMMVRFGHGMYSTIVLDLPVFAAATVSVSIFYVATVRELGLGWWERLKYLPFVMSLGIGMAVNQCTAVVEALFDRQSEFTRTPKTGATRSQPGVVSPRYRVKVSWVPVVELALGMYFTAAMVMAVDAGMYSSLPFLVLFQGGFLYVSLASLAHTVGLALSPSKA